MHLCTVEWVYVCTAKRLTYSIKEFPTISILQEQVVEVPTGTLTKEADHMIMTQHLHDTYLWGYTKIQLFSTLFNSLKLGDYRAGASASARLGV